MNPTHVSAGVAGGSVVSSQIAELLGYYWPQMPANIQEIWAGMISAGLALGFVIARYYLAKDAPDLAKALTGDQIVAPPDAHSVTTAVVQPPAVVPVPVTPPPPPPPPVVASVAGPVGAPVP